MIKAIQAKPSTGMTFSPSPAQQNPSESVAAPAEVGQGLGTPSFYFRLLFLLSSLIVFLMISPMAMATTASIQSSPFMVNASISSISYLLMGVIVLAAVVVLALNLLALAIWWCFVIPHLEKRA